MSPSVSLSPMLLGLPERYEVLRELGRGAMGRVLLATDRYLERQVALKVLVGEPAEQNASKSDAIDLAAEARLLAQLSHPAIVPVLDVIVGVEGPIVIMEYVTGGSVGARMTAGAWPGRAETYRILLQVAQALQYAHDRGVVHCDVKPDNILLDQATRTARLADFGIARLLSDGTTLRASGSPGYVAPEVVEGSAATARSDIYGLGIVAWELLAQRRAFAGAHTSIVLARQLVGQLPPISSIAADIPLDVRETIARCQTLDPMDRPANLSEFISILEQEVATSTNAHDRQLRGLGFLLVLPIVACIVFVVVVGVEWSVLHELVVNSVAARPRLVLRLEVLAWLVLAMVAGFAILLVQTMRRRLRTGSDTTTGWRTLFRRPTWWPTVYPGDSDPLVSELPASVRRLRFATWWLAPPLIVGLLTTMLLALAPTPIVSVSAARVTVGVGGALLILFAVLIFSITTTYAEGTDFDAIDLLPVILVRRPSLGVIARLRDREAEIQRAEIDRRKRNFIVGALAMMLLAAAVFLSDMRR